MRIPSLAAVLCVILCLMGAIAARLRASAQSNQPPELKKLDVWSGQWTTKGKLYDTPHSHAGEITITMTCAWSAYGGYMICDHLINSRAGQRNDLSIFTYNLADKSYKFCGFHQTGVPRSTPLTIEGNTWSYDADEEENGKKVHVKTINDFSHPGIVTWNTKFSEDGGAHWTLMNEGVDTKVR